MTNMYPGACACGVWVQKGKGKANQPATRGDRWTVTCQACMTPGDKVDHQRQTEQLATAQRQHAARTA